MTEKVADVVARELAGFEEIPDWQAKFEAMKSQLDAQALVYLKAKFPGFDEAIFFTDSRGVKREHITDAEDICDAAKIDYACANCKNAECLLPENFKNRNSRPVVLIRENQDGINFLCVRWTSGLKCHNENVNGEFMCLFRQSGLTQSQMHMTFDSYNVASGTKSAKIQAWKAAKEQSCLILAGKAGTGKTHLAVAIALYAMKSGRPAIFRLVSELVDELREANRDNSSRYYELIKTYKEVPCLVLDDMGKERTTRAGLDYVYQIVDYRYRHELQTILTTNAPDSDTLSKWGDEEYIVPMISRIRGRGMWVTIEQANDYRQVKSNAVTR